MLDACLAALRPMHRCDCLRVGRGGGTGPGSQVALGRRHHPCQLGLGIEPEAEAVPVTGKRTYDPLG